VQAPDAVAIDSTVMTIDEVLAVMLEVVRKRRSRAGCSENDGGEKP
jgi:cytidylate kinase